MNLGDETMTTIDGPESTARLVILAGLPGSGKTTLSSWLAKEHGFTVSSRDVIRAAMFPRCSYTAAEKANAFEAMKLAIKTMLDLGLAVVTDGICFSSTVGVEEVRAVGAAAGVPIDIIDCRCTVPIAQARVEHDRLKDPTVPADRDSALVQIVADRFEALPDSAMPLDMTASVADIRTAAALMLGLAVTA